MAGEYAAWVSTRALNQLIELDPYAVIIFVYLRALTKDATHPAEAERIARISKRKLGSVAERLAQLRRLGMVTSDWLGYQPNDSSRKSWISVAALNTLYEMQVPDRLQVFLFYILGFADQEGRVTKGATQMAVYSGLKPSAVFRAITDLEKRELIVDGKIAEFLRRK